MLTGFVKLDVKVEVRYSRLVGGRNASSTKCEENLRIRASFYSLKYFFVYYLTVLINNNLGLKTYN